MTFASKKDCYVMRILFSISSNVIRLDAFDYCHFYTYLTHYSYAKSDDHSEVFLNRNIDVLISKDR